MQKKKERNKEKRRRNKRKERMNSCARREEGKMKSGTPKKKNTTHLDMTVTLE
jgi:hypothetical protein